jgi:hypothetical protein
MATLSRIARLGGERRHPARPKSLKAAARASIVVRTLLALTFACRPIVADAGLIRIVHLDCDQWRARQHMLAHRKAHPIGRHALRANRVRIHYVCDCEDGAEGVSPTDGDGEGAAIGSAQRAASNGADILGLSFAASLGGSGSTGSFAGVLGGVGGPSGNSSANTAFPWIPSDPLNPYPTTPSVPPVPSFPPAPSPVPVDPTPPGPVQAVPEPSTWLLLGLGSALLFGLKRRTNGTAA